MQTKHLVPRLSLLFLPLCLATTMIASPAKASTATSTYPLLPDLPGADISGESRIAIHLDRELILVELDGTLYALGDRPLEIDFAELERVTLLLIVPEDMGIFVTEDGVLIEELEPRAASSTITFDLIDPLITLGFEVTRVGQQAPTVPDLVIPPIESDPDPV